MTRDEADDLGKGYMFWTLLIKEFGFCSEELRKPLKVFKHLSTLHLLFEVVYELEPRQGETG